jgi:hypothetical protein
MSTHIQSEIPDDIEKDDPVHLDDLRTVLLEENWVTAPTSLSLGGNDMAFRKNGTDYDNIVVKGVDHDRSFWVTVPLPASPGAYCTRVANALDVYLYVTTFIEYYAETTLAMQYKTQTFTNTRSALVG